MEKEFIMAALLIGVLLAGLAVIGAVKKKKRKQPAEEGEDNGMTMPDTRADGRKTAVSCFTEGTAEDPSARKERLSLTGGPVRERTMMLTYTTLILKDRDRPARSYKADMFTPVYIGRGRENTIHLGDESVSRRHLKVYRMDGLVYAENLSRVNGTKLNGRYLTQPKEIVSGNLLELGRMKLIVEID